MSTRPERTPAHWSGELPLTRPGSAERANVLAAASQYSYFADHGVENEQPPEPDSLDAGSQGSSGPLLLIINSK